MPYSAILSTGSVRLMFVADRDLAATVLAVEAAQAAVEAVVGGPNAPVAGVIGVGPNPGVPPAVVIGALDPMVV